MLNSIRVLKVGSDYCSLFRNGNDGNWDINDYGAIHYTNGGKSSNIKTVNNRKSIKWRGREVKW